MAATVTKRLQIYSQQRRLHGMRSFEATALIEAGPDAVWAILTDGPG